VYRRVAFCAAFLFAAIPLLSVGGCATLFPSSTQALASADPGDGSRTTAEATANPSDAALVLAAQFANDYRVAPKDVLEVTVYRVPDLSATVTVNPGGYIQLPLAGQVLAGGRTVAEVKTSITAKLAMYLQSPDVSVVVKDAASQRVTIEGAVAKPGVYPADGVTTLLQVVALAGGLDRIADSRGIVVFRNVDGKRQAAKFDFKAITAGTAEDPVMVGGDVIVVDESGAKSAFRAFKESLGVVGFFVPFL
jgi:polysaccharide biosynthesis/export protein